MANYLHFHVALSHYMIDGFLMLKLLYSADLEAAVYSSTFVVDLKKLLYCCWNLCRMSDNRTQMMIDTEVFLFRLFTAKKVENTRFCITAYKKRIVLP